MRHSSIRERNFDSLPLLWTDPGESNVPELIWNTGKGDPVPANAGSIAVDANSNPYILNKARGDTIYFHHLSPVIDRKGVLLAKGYVTRDFNASVDKTAITQGWLSMMLTENMHSGVNHNKGSFPTDAFVMNIPLALLDDFDKPFIRR